MDTTTNYSDAFQSQSRMFRTLDTHEIAAGGESLETSWADYAKYGITTAATSAVVGIMNTGVAFGELLGVAGVDSYIDESSAVNTLLGADAQSFYNKHKTGVDAGGMILGALVPGMAAIRGLRALQTAGKVSSPLQAATGLRNPDMLLGSSVVEAAKRAALETTTAAPNWFAPHMVKAYAQGAKQQLAEALVFEAAVLVTMNQNATLNPDNLSYIDAIQDQFWEATAWAGVGGALGGVVDGFRVVGAVRKHGDEKLTETARLSNVSLLLPSGFDDLVAGNKLVSLGKAAAEHNKLKDSWGEMDWLAQREFKSGQEQIKSAVLGAFKEMNNAGAAGYEALEELLGNAGPDNLESLANVLSGMRKLENVSVTDLQDLTKFYDLTRAPSIVMRSDNLMDIADQLERRQEEFFDLIKRVAPEVGEGQHAYDGTVFQLNILADNDEATTAGFAYSGAYLDNALTKFNVKVATTSEGQLQFIPGFGVQNTKATQYLYDLNKAMAESRGQKYTQTYEEFDAYVFAHELSHVKSNSDRMLNYVKRSFLDLGEQAGKELKKAQRVGKAAVDDFYTNAKYKNSIKYKLTRDLVALSLEARPQFWQNKFTPGLVNAKPEVQLEAVMESLLKPDWQQGPLNYFGRPAELLADGGALMTEKATRELASKKYPTAAKFFNEGGALAKAWEPTKAYYNSRTKEMLSSYLPGVRDVDPELGITVTADGMKLRSAKLNRTFDYDSSKFSSEAFGKALTSKLDFLEYDAMWTMAASMRAADFVDSSGVVRINTRDLPRMEKLAMMYSAGDKDIVKAFDSGQVYLGDSVVLAQALPELTKQAKMEMRDLLVASTTKYNEHQISKILNIDIAQATGDLSANDDGWMLMLAGKNFSKPEVFAAKFDRRNMEDYDKAVMNMVGVEAQNEAIAAQMQTASAELTGKLYGLLPEIPRDLLTTLNPFASRAGMLSNMRSAFGSLRESAQYVGKLVQQAAVNLTEQVDKSYITHAAKFNKLENQQLRFELANVDNLLRREMYYLAETPTGSVILRKDRLIEAMQGKFDPIMLRGGIPDDVIATVMEAGNDFAPGGVRLSDDVAQFMAQHSNVNQNLVDRKRTLFAAKGRTSTLDPYVLYAPPRDLSQSKYTAFIRPSVFKEGSDNRTFMIYAESEAEFEQKKLAIKSKYKDDYEIFNKTDAKEYAQAKQAYDEGNVFDELYFDATLMNKGKSSELMPNADLRSSATLERYRVWNIKQEESLLRAGVELKYNDVFTGLNSMNKFHAKVEDAALDKRWREPATIWKDTAATMLNYRARGSNIEQGWVRVNDFLGEKGSQLAESILTGLGRRSKDGIKAEDLAEFNDKMAKAGFKSPFDDITQIMLSSPDTTKSNLLPSAVRTLSNLISTTMLRLDMANSALQLISTPILMLPVLQEAKLALKGTPAGDRLKGATTVLNPATGDYEPSIMKLATTAVRKFWSPAGKEFMQELYDRNIINDHMSQYLRVTDMSQLNGRHSMQAVNEAIDKVAHYGSKVSAHNWSEQFTRFLVAQSVKDICEIRGLGKDESWAMISSAVDKVHGVYSGAQRPQLFQGVLGQSVGLYQTYFFNFAQNLLKYTADGDRKQVAIMSAMQTSLFGIQSLPGFQALNSAIGNSNRNNEDLYTLTNADDPDVATKYAMYGLASTMFGVNIDFTTRGSLAARNMLVIPTRLEDLPIVGTLAKAYDNAKQTVGNVTEDNVSVKNALLHGLAHNGMNRPLQGLANIVLGDVYTKEGQIDFMSSNRINYDLNNDFNWGAMFARAIGTRPLNETIVKSAHFRSTAYQANNRRQIADLSGQLQLSLADGTIGSQDYASFATDYEKTGGEIQNFNAYWGRQLKASTDGAMNQFQQELLAGKDSVLGRAQIRMELQQSTTTPWDTDY